MVLEAKMDKLCNSVYFNRSLLQAHLLTSDKYAVSLILNKIQGTVLKKELAILYGKLQVSLHSARLLLT